MQMSLLDNYLLILLQWCKLQKERLILLHSLPQISSQMVGSLRSQLLLGLKQDVCVYIHCSGVSNPQLMILKLSQPQYRAKPADLL